MSATYSPILPSKGLGHTLVRNTLANFGGQIALTALTVMSTPYIVNRFGARAYGVLMLLLTFVNMLSLFQLGINASLVKYLAGAMSRHAYADAHLYVRTCLGLFLITATIAVASQIPIAPWWIQKVFHVPADLKSDALTGFYLAAAAFWIRFVGDAYSAVPIAAQRFDFVNVISVGSEFIRVLGSVAAVFMGYRIPGICVVILAANLVYLGGNVIAARWIMPSLSLKPALSWPALRDLFHFSKFVLIANISGRAVHSLDSLLIGHFLPISYVSFYSIPCGLTQKVWTVVGNVTTAVYPANCSMTGPEQANRVRELYLRSSKIVSALAMVPTCALYVLAYEILRYWISPDFAHQAAATLRILSVAFFLNVLAHIPFSVSQAQGRPEIAAWLSAGNAVVNVSMCFILIPKFGIVGAATGFLISQIVLAPAFVWAANRLVGVDWRTQVSRSYSRVSLVGIVSWLIFLSLRSQVSSVLSLLSVLSVGGLFSIGMVWFFVLDHKERQPLQGVMQIPVLGIGSKL